MKTELAKPSNKEVTASTAHAANELKGANGDSLNFNAGVEFTLLHKSFTAIVAKSDNKVQFVLQPTPGGKDKPCSISEVCTGINQTVTNLTKTPSLDNPLDTGSVVEQMKSYVSGATDAYKVNLNEIFLYICKDSSVTPAKTTFEYAFSLSVDMKDADVGLDAASLESVYVNIWNTERANILSKMSMGDIEELLNS